MEIEQNPSSEHELLVRVARMYYEHDLNQQEIAERVGLSRSRISRLLTRAREVGIVQVTIVDEFQEEHGLSRELESMYGLKRVVVCPISESSPKPLRWHLGQAAARLLKEIIRDGDVIGVTGGTTMLEMARALKPLPIKRENVKIVQLEGALSGKGEALIHGNEIVAKVAAAFDAPPYFLSAPTIVESRELRDALARDPNLRRILEKGRQANIAIFSVGRPSKSCILAQAGYLSAEDIDVLLSKGAVGDICSRFFTADGSVCDESLNDRTIGLELDELTQKESCILVAGGPKKIPGIAGALRGGFANMLVTDEITARTLVDSADGAL
ncbi:MAG: sugar-binding transcriptional regulator [Bacillota bacterium]|nr:sugar-binding transcriptional regulator [Bacillota bacterium]HOB42894.1 sugar-binding transcriptional regulator [Bacillota bacterium]HOK70188.1 sugar-binding transcriptional regulator [Bacillota bacterium]HOL52287.1 sugar-binding transcriptional regulator [Bacillota bacterium]HOO30141.1 sugar-binding transcriptional regulator [Bacillota bacterium]